MRAGGRLGSWRGSPSRLPERARFDLEGRWGTRGARRDEHGWLPPPLWGWGCGYLPFCGDGDGDNNPLSGSVDPDGSTLARASADVVALRALQGVGAGGASSISVSGADSGAGGGGADLDGTDADLAFGCRFDFLPAAAGLAPAPTANLRPVAAKSKFGSPSGAWLMSESEGPAT